MKGFLTVGLVAVLGIVALDFFVPEDYRGFVVLGLAVWFVVWRFRRDKAAATADSSSGMKGWLAVGFFLLIVFVFLASFIGQMGATTGFAMGLAAFLMGAFLLYVWLFSIGRGKVTARWAKWPTVEEYLAKHPSDRGIVCWQCGGRHLHQYGWVDAKDSRRYHKCMDCNIVLYRTGED